MRDNIALLQIPVNNAKNESVVILTAQAFCSLEDPCMSLQCRHRRVLHRSADKSCRFAERNAPPDNHPMPQSPWQRRIQRAEDLARQYAFATEILAFYIHLARFQEEFHRELESVAPKQASSALTEVIGAEGLTVLGTKFESFLSLVHTHGPKLLAELARELRGRGKVHCSALLQDAWTVCSPSNAREFLSQAFLQPYAELLRSCAWLPPAEGRYAICPFCHRKPSLGVLRQMREGASRSLVCGFCVAEWNFRRLVCPGCGEEDDQKLPVFTASDFDYIRVECCETCKTYIKTIDLTKNGRAEPTVDELASAPLDLWAREHGYAKLQPNLLGI